MIDNKMNNNTFEDTEYTNNIYGGGSAQKTLLRGRQQLPKIDRTVRNFSSLPYNALSTPPQD